MPDTVELLQLFMARQLFDVFRADNTSGEIPDQDLWKLIVDMSRRTVDTLTIVDGVLTIPGPGVYIVQPETGLTDVLDQIIDTCRIGEIITLLTDPDGGHQCLVTLDSGSNNINTPLGEDVVIGHTAIGGVAATTTICQLIKCQSASPAGCWYIIGSGGTNDYGWITGNLRHSGTKVGFFGTPGGADPSIVQPDAYTPTNVTADRAFDADNTSMDEIADVLGTVIADLKAYGLFK